MSTVVSAPMYELGDGDDRYRVQVLHLADGRTIGYRIDERDGREEFSIVDSGVLAALLEMETK